MKLSNVLPPIAIGFLCTPIAVILLDSQSYQLHTFQDWLWTLFGVALPGAAIGLIAIRFKFPTLLTILGAVLAGWSYPIAPLAYGLVIGKADGPIPLTQNESTVAFAIGALAIVVIGSFPGVYFAFGRFLVRILRARLPTHF